MKIYSDISLSDFEWWSGAKDTADRINEANNTSRYDLWIELEAILEDMEPADGWTETALNDLLWFESETVLEWLGIEDENEEEEDEDED